MRLIFMGTPEFAVPTLERIVSAGHQVLAVYTQPDRPKGRGHNLAKPPVKEAAQSMSLPVLQPERIRHGENVEHLASLAPDAMVVVGYGQIIPQSIIDVPRFGIVNVHGSLLPKYRGAAPIQWAVANGETVTGVTTMRIDAGLDTGDMLMKASTEIGAAETAPELGRRLAQTGAELLVETLSRLEQGTIEPERQDPSEATLAPILKKENGRIDWSRPASEIYNRGRGFLPWPGIYTNFRGQLFHIWRSKPAYDISLGPPGTIRALGRRLMVACGQDTALELDEVQLEGRKRVSADAFCSGQRLMSDDMLGERKN